MISVSTPRNIVFALCLICCTATTAAQHPDTGTPDIYRQLRMLSAHHLNTSSMLPEDSLLHLTWQVEALARERGDISEEFKAGQVQTNLYGLSGKFGLAVNKAQLLLEKARTLNNPLALGLALQAVGNNYMHSGRFGQADSIFDEAAPYIHQYGDTIERIHLIFQQMHIYMSNEDTTRLQESINETRHLLIECGNDEEIKWHGLLLSFYETFHALLTKNMERVQVLLSEIARNRPRDGSVDLWYYETLARYHTGLNEYDKALSYSDSSLLITHATPNKNIRQRVLLQRASFLENVQQHKQASELYEKLLEIADSLYTSNYTAQIDSLHIAYWVDHMQVANLTSRNKLYTWTIYGLLLLVAMTVPVVVIVRRKNNQLVSSRLRLQALREASADSIRSKSLFLSNMSHELRTPLNAITGFSTILTQDEDLDDETREQCGAYIRQNADLLLKLINDVVDVSGLSGDSIRFSFEQCDVVALCRNVLQTVDNVKRTQATMQFETTLDQLVINTDKNRLQQVLINLLVNATKFTPEGTITLRLESDPANDNAVFTVEDTGCGIPLEKQPRIFERFEKLHEGAQGAGLGLSICRLIVEHVGGQISIDSNYTRGARFLFTHPLHYSPKPIES